MIVHDYAQRRGCLDDIFSDYNVRFRRAWMTGGMVVHEDQSRSFQLKGTFDDLAGVNQRVVDRAPLLPFVLHQRVLAIEKQYMKFLYLAVSDLRVAVIDQLAP